MQNDIIDCIGCGDYDLRNCIPGIYHIRIHCDPHNHPQTGIQTIWKEGMVMRSKQCKGCEYYLSETRGCIRNKHSETYTDKQGNIEEHYFYDNIGTINRCELANNGNGGVHNVRTN